MNQYDLNGRFAIVTGGARGIGREIARQLKIAGASVSVWDIRPPQDAHLIDDVQTLDLTDEAAVNAAMERVRALFPRLDILVNGVGISGVTVPTEAYDFAEWKRTLAINLDSVFLASRAAIPAMRENGYGRIVNIASVASKEGNPNMCAYSASKGGVLTFTKALARELADTGILVNAITPALIETELLNDMSPESVALSRSKIPLGRIGQTREVAAMVTWMCSDDCSFSTGATFDISGGRSTY